MICGKCLEQEYEYVVSKDINSEDVSIQECYESNRTRLHEVIKN